MSRTTLNEIWDFMQHHGYDQVSFGRHSRDGGCFILRSARTRLPTPIFGRGHDAESAWADLLAKEGPPPATRQGCTGTEDLDLDLTEPDDLDLDLDLTEPDDLDLDLDS